VRKGIYQEIVYFRNKDKVSFIGEGRDATVVRYANNEVFNPHPVNIRTNELAGTFPSRRAAFAADNSNDLHIMNLTLETTAPGQSEGLLMTGQRNTLKNVRVIGFGDAFASERIGLHRGQSHRGRRATRSLVAGLRSSIIAC
jgi:pectin methylesterase-like acyl-CoA thioesterase